MKYVLTNHARTVLAARGIEVEWMERTLAQPGLVENDSSDPNLEHRLLPIEEYDRRVLRVIVDNSVEPMRVVSVFFDRRMRGRV